MARRHNKQDALRFPAPGAHPHVYDAATQEIPRFKRKAVYQPPRYSPVLCLAWGGSLFIAILDFVKGIHADHTEWHYVADGGVAVALLICVSFLWAAWEREECYPQLLPKREFERRYPPSSASGPCDPELPESRPFHRRLIYTEDNTATGSTINPGEDRCG